MPSIAYTTKREVLLRVRNKLQTTVPKYRDRVFVVSGDDIADNLRDREFLTVSIAGGQFDFAAMSGGYALPYQASLRVNFYKIHRLDRQGTDESVLLDLDGLLTDEMSVISSLYQSYLDEGLCGEPETKILAEPLMPLSDSEMVRMSDEAFGGSGKSDQARCVLTLEFGCKFHMSSRIVEALT